MRLFQHLVVVLLVHASVLILRGAGHPHELLQMLLVDVITVILVEVVHKHFPPA